MDNLNKLFDLCFQSLDYKYQPDKVKEKRILEDNKSLHHILLLCEMSDWMGFGEWLLRRSSTQPSIPP